MSENVENTENLYMIEHCENQRVLPQFKKCMSKVYHVNSICFITFVSSFVAMILLCFFLLSQHQVQNVCYSQANMEENGSNSEWLWNNGSCNGELFVNQNLVKIYKKGLYMIHVQVSFEVKKDMDPELHSIRLLVRSNMKERTISSGIPIINNITPDNIPISIDSSFLLEQGDRIKMEINFDVTKIVKSEERTFWYIYGITNLYGD